MKLLKRIIETFKDSREFNRALRKIKPLIAHSKSTTTAVRLNNNQMELLYELSCRGITNVDEFESYEKALDEKEKVNK